MRPSASGSGSSQVSSSPSSKSLASSSCCAWRRGKMRTMRLSLAPACMTKCMAAPSEALAHSPAAVLRGAHSAISLDVLVPQAKRSSMVPTTRKARPATNETAASGRNGPMTWAPAMKKSPKMPPRPFGRGQLLGCGRAASAAASKMTAAGQASSLSLRRFGTVRNTRCHPQAASGRKRMIEASPKDWMARSATTAPQFPSTLRGAARVALLRLGSCTDQVARLAQAAQATVTMPRP